MKRETFNQYLESDIAPNAYAEWFEAVRETLETAYLLADTPWGQSGKSGSYEEWVRLRLPLSECIQREGKFLDIGCANGFLLDCLLMWTAAKGLELQPFGLDISPKLISLARERLPNFAANLYQGNIWDWQAPLKFDFVRTELVYVPKPSRPAYIQRLLDEMLVKGGRLIIAHYRSRSEDLTSGWADVDLAAWGFKMAEIFSGYDGQGRERARFICLDKTWLNLRFLFILNHHIV